MEFEFKDIIGEHELKYPRMEVQDYAKLAYQNEFGPQHLAEKERFLKGIQSELEELSGDSVMQTAERIGNGLSRIPLCQLSYPETDASLLAQLMVLTVTQHRGTQEGLERKLNIIEANLGAEEKQWLERYRAEGCLPVHHSETFRSTYQPHYRVIKTEYADWFPVLSQIQKLLAEMESAVISVDGRCGSGKSSLAAVIKEVFSCNVFHMDDFYRPPQMRSDDWMNIPAGNMDLDRFKAEVIQPVKKGESVLYRPFDCQRGEITEAFSVSPTQLTVIEGSYSQHPLLADQYDLKIFLTCDKDVQTKRLTEREGDYVQSFFSCWIPMEERYFEAFDVEKKSDMLVDTGKFR